MSAIAFSKSTPDFDGAEHLVAGAEHALEQAELLGEELEDALVGGVALVREVHDDDVVLLAVAVDTADALLDALRVPGQVVVDDAASRTGG